MDVYNKTVKQTALKRDYVHKHTKTIEKRQNNNNKHETNKHAEQYIYKNLHINIRQYARMLIILRYKTLMEFGYANIPGFLRQRFTSKTKCPRGHIYHQLTVACSTHTPDILRAIRANTYGSSRGKFAYCLLHP